MAQKRNFQAAVTSFGAHARFNPSATAFGNLGTAHMDSGQYELAEQALRRALSYNPEDLHTIGNLQNLCSSSVRNYVCTGGPVPTSTLLSTQ